MDAVLCAAVLAYAAGHYRLLSLVHTAFPIDYRRPPPAGPRDDRRPPPTAGAAVGAPAGAVGNAAAGPDRGGMGRGRFAVVAGAVGS